MDGATRAGGRFYAAQFGRGAWIAVAFLLAASPLREVGRSLVRQRVSGVPLDTRLAPLVRALPASGPVGWVEDDSQHQRAMEARVALQYAAAPRIVTGETAGQSSIVAWAPNAQSLDRLLNGRGLRAVSRFAEGYVLCEWSEGP